MHFQVFKFIMDSIISFTYFEHWLIIYLLYGPPRTIDVFAMLNIDMR